MSNPGEMLLRRTLDLRFLLHRKLQDPRPLSRAKMRKQNDLAIGKFKRIMVRVWIVHVDLPEPRHSVTDFSLAAPEKDELPTGEHALDCLLETDFGAGKKAHSYFWLSHRGESAGCRVPETRRYEVVLHLGRSGLNTVQTVIAHGVGS